MPKKKLSEQETFLKKRPHMSWSRNLPLHPSRQFSINLRAVTARGAYTCEKN